MDKQHQSTVSGGKAGWGNLTACNPGPWDTWLLQFNKERLQVIAYFSGGLENYPKEKANSTITDAGLFQPPKPLWNRSRRKERVTRKLSCLQVNELPKRWFQVHSSLPIQFRFYYHPPKLVLLKNNILTLKSNVFIHCKYRRHFSCS